MLLGQEQHVGTKAPPREIAIENAVLPTNEPTVVRCIVSILKSFYIEKLVLKCAKYVAKIMFNFR